MTKPRPVRAEDTRHGLFDRMRTMWIALNTVEDGWGDIAEAVGVQFAKVQDQAADSGWINREAEDYFQWGGPGPRTVRKAPVTQTEADCNYCGRHFVVTGALRLCPDPECVGVASVVTMVQVPIPVPRASVRRAVRK